MNVNKLIISILICVMIFCNTACSSSQENEAEYVEKEKIETKQISIETPNVVLENVDNGVRITWNEVPDASGYYIYSKTEGVDYSRIADISDPKTTEYIDNMAMVKTQYSYAVIAYMETRSDFERISINTEIWKPEYRVIYEDSMMKLEWNKVEGCDGYVIYRKETGEDFSTIATINDNSITVYNDKTVLPGKVYAYAIRAYVGNEKSPYTSLACASIDKTNLSVENLGGEIKLIWDEVKYSDGYYVYRKVDGGEYEVINTINNNKTTQYIDKGYIKGKKNIYAVRPYLGEYKGDYTPVEITVE